MPKTAGAVRRKVKTPAEGRTKLTQNFVNLSVCGQRGFSDKRKNAVTANPILNKTGGKPFMAKVELKQPVVAEIAEVLNGAKSAVVVDYRGLTVEQDTALRKQLREAGVSYKVYKNTMIRFAAKGTEFEALEMFFLEDFLEACSLRSQTSLVFSTRSQRRTAKAQKLRQRLNPHPGPAGGNTHRVIPSKAA